jgi:hypothetical protein
MATESLQSVQRERVFQTAEWRDVVMSNYAVDAAGRIELEAFDGRWR